MLFFVAVSGLDGNRMAFAQTNAPKKPKTEKVDSIELNGEVYDRMTTRHVPETKIEIYRQTVRHALYQQQPCVSLWGMPFMSKIPFREDIKTT